MKYAGDVRTHALEALKLNPKHPGALHVMGMWNYNVMSLSGMTRFMAKTFLGGKVFDSANWDDAQRYMEESVAVGSRSAGPSSRPGARLRGARRQDEGRASSTRS